MILLNFSHPLTAAQREPIKTLTGQTIARALDLPPQVDKQQPFAPQLAGLLTQIDLTPAQWQGEPILVVLPSLNFIAAALLAELHGRMGYFLPLVRTRPVADSLPRLIAYSGVMRWWRVGICRVYVRRRAKRVEQENQTEQELYCL